MLDTNPTSLGLSLNWKTADALSPPNLKPGQLHLWCLPLKLDNALHASAITLLNDTQRDKYHRRNGPALRESYLAGRYYLMHLLAAYTDTTPDNVLLSYTRLNKPYLNPNPKDMRFNFTDTHFDGQSWGIFAFVCERDVGVDIEHLERQSNFAAIASRRLAEAELEYVRGSDGKVDAQRFLACWTRKEAYGKATGQGINFTMRDVDLASPGAFELNFIDGSSPSRAFKLSQIEVGDEMIGAVVVEGHEPLSIQAFTSENHIP